MNANRDMFFRERDEKRRRREAARRRNTLGSASEAPAPGVSEGVPERDATVDPSRGHPPRGC